MPTSEAHVTTDRADRYLRQLCSHAARTYHHDGPHQAQAQATSETTSETTSATTGRITFGTASCELTAGPAALVLRATADDDEQLRALKQRVAETLERVGRREGLAVVWT